MAKANDPALTLINSYPDPGCECSPMIGDVIFRGRQFIHVALWVFVLVYGLCILVVFPYDPNALANNNTTHPIFLNMTEPVISSATTGVAISGYLCTAIAVGLIILHGSMYAIFGYKNDETAIALFENPKTNFATKTIIAFAVYGLIASGYLALMMSSDRANWRFPVAVSMVVANVVANCLLYVNMRTLVEVFLNKSSGPMGPQPFPTWFFLSFIGALEFVTYVGISSEDFGLVDEGDKLLSAIVFWTMFVVLCMIFVMSMQYSMAPKATKTSKKKNAVDTLGRFPVAAALVMSAMLCVSFLSVYRISFLMINAGQNKMVSQNILNKLSPEEHLLALHKNAGAQAGLALCLLSSLLQVGLVTRVFASASSPVPGPSEEDKSKYPLMNT